MAQACGGGWGGPLDAIRQMEDPANHCARAEGPFPQGTGTLTCMSRALALLTARDERFGEWLAVARARNDYGAPCQTAAACAAHPPATHMWHHEDAGVSYNVWRSLARGIAASTGDGSPSAPPAGAAQGAGGGAGGGVGGRKVYVVHLPEKGWFWPWFNEAAFSPPMSAKAIVVHKVVDEALWAKVRAAWDVAAPLPRVVADCSQTCASWGWTRARVACDAPPPLPERPAGSWRGYVPRWNGTLCPLTPARHFECCFLREAKEGEARAV